MVSRSGLVRENPTEYVKKKVAPLKKKEFIDTALLYVVFKLYCVVEAFATIVMPFFVGDFFWSITSACLTIVWLCFITRLKDIDRKKEAPYLVDLFFEYGPWLIFPVCKFWGPESVHFFSLLMGRGGDATTGVLKENKVFAMFGPTISAYTSWFYSKSFAFLLLAIVFILLGYWLYSNQGTDNQTNDEIGVPNYPVEPRQYYFKLGVIAILCIFLILSSYFTLYKETQKGDHITCEHAEYKKVWENNKTALFPFEEDKVKQPQSFLHLTDYALLKCATRGIEPRQCFAYYWPYELQWENWYDGKGFTKTLDGNGKKKKLVMLSDKELEIQCQIYNEQAKCMEGAENSPSQKGDSPITGATRTLLREVYSATYMVVFFKFDTLLAHLSCKSSIFASDWVAKTVTSMLVNTKEEEKQTKTHYCSISLTGNLKDSSSKKYMHTLHFNQYFVPQHLRVEVLFLKSFGYLAILFFYVYEIEDNSKLEFDWWSFTRLLLCQLLNPLIWAVVTLALVVWGCNVSLTVDLLIYIPLIAGCLYAMSKGVFGCAKRFVCTLCSFVPVKQADVAEQETTENKADTRKKNKK